MKRPKIADMTQLELGRFRLLQFYRGARRQLDHLKYVDETEMTPAGVQKLNKLRLEMPRSPQAAGFSFFTWARSPASRALTLAKWALLCAPDDIRWVGGTFLQNPFCMPLWPLDRTGQIGDIDRSTRRRRIPMSAEEDENQRWLDIVIRAFERLGTRPSLSAVYDEVGRLISATKFQSNRAPEATVRRLLQSYCATSPQFGGKESFLNPSRRKWRLDKDAAERRWQSREEACKFLAELGL